ncbi:MAG: response regulator transcription factor [Acetobacteraceae bacterium]
MRVLLADDDSALAGMLSLALRSDGVVVDQASSGEEVLELVRHYDYDIVVLDLMLPDVDGYEVVRRMRSARIETPVLILSGISRPQAKVKGLGVGADDFVTKPFDSSELRARMQAIIRRSRGLSRPVLQIRELRIDLDCKEVTVRGIRVPLTAKEYAILELLALRKGFVLSKEAFLNHLYGGMDEPEIKIVDVFVCKLRKKLAQAGLTDLIETVWGQGYLVREGGRGTAPVSGLEAAMTGTAMAREPERAALT